MREGGSNEKLPHNCTDSSRRILGFTTYRELINDEWASLLEAMFERGKLCWSYNLPEQIEERAELRRLCERMLPFENHYLRAHRAYLLAQRGSNNETAKQIALQGLKQVIYPDEAGDKLS